MLKGLAEGEVVYSKEEATSSFREQEASTDLPYIYLSAGVRCRAFLQENACFCA